MTRLSVSLTLAIIVAPSLAFAECLALSLRNSIRPAAVAFSGTATTITNTDTASDSWAGTVVTFEVDRVWKGAVTRRFSVYSFTRTAEGMNFTAGKRYLVFAHSPTNEERRDLRLETKQGVVVGQCGDGSKELAEIPAASLVELGAGHAPSR
jgi:hypothetical protein